MKLPVYQSRAHSGSDWLGDIPNSWEISRLKFLLAKNDGGVWGEEDDPDGTIVLRSTDQTLDGGWKIEDPARRSLTIKEQKECRLKSGDLVVTKSSGSALHIGKTSLVNSEIAEMGACFSNFMQRLRVSDSLAPRIAFYLLNSPTGRQQSVVNSNTTTGLANLNGTVLGDIVLAVPSPGEQRAIANFLDRETARLDTLVEKKRELIGKLKEKRTALISRTVTRGLPAEAAARAGLNPHPRLKPSGIEWLGDIPEHWEVKKFSRCAFFQEGPGLRNWQFAGSGVRVICVTNITDRGIDFSSYEKFITDEEYQSAYRHFTVQSGDLLLSSSGNSWGKIAPFDSQEPAILNTSTIRVNENSSRTVVRSYLLWLLTSETTREQLGLSMTGSCQPNFGPTHLARVFVAIPPVSEQIALADFLDRETAKIDKMMEKVEAAIEKLQEYRTALITAAVTGKIDVRNAAKDSQ